MKAQDCFFKVADVTHKDDTVTQWQVRYSPDKNDWKDMFILGSYCPSTGVCHLTDREIEIDILTAFTVIVREVLILRVGEIRDVTSIIQERH